MRLLQIVKDAQRREWVFEKDAVSGEDLPRHYSLGSFDRGEFIQFRNTNNQIVEVALDWGMEQLEGYDAFYQQGMRVCQQIEFAGDKSGGRKLGVLVEDEDGVKRIMSFKDRCEQDYERRASDLEKRVIGKIAVEKKRRRDKQYDDLYAGVNGLLPAEDVRYIRDILTKLIENKIVVRDSINGMQLSFTQKIDSLKKDETAEIVEFFPRVPDKIKPYFLHVVKYAELNESKHDWWGYSVDELFKFIERIGEVNAVNYLHSLLISLERNENVYELQNLVSYSVDNEVGQERAGDYFDSILLIQRLGYDGDDAVRYAGQRIDINPEFRGNYNSLLDMVRRDFKKVGWAIIEVAVKKPSFLEDFQSLQRLAESYRSSTDEFKTLEWLRNS